MQVYNINIYINILRYFRRLFTDTVPGVVKKVFITLDDGTTKVYNESLTIRIDIISNKILAYNIDDLHLYTFKMPALR